MLFMAVTCITACGCITNSSTDIMKINATPVPVASVPAIATPAPLANNTVTATPMPVSSVNKTNESHVLTPGLPPAVIFTYVPPIGSSDKLKGMVGGVDPSRYRLAIFANVHGWWNVPSRNEPLTTINSDGSWECDITGGGSGVIATQIDAYLVPEGFTPPTVKGRYSIPPELKSGSIASNIVKCKSLSQ